MKWRNGYLQASIIDGIVQGKKRTSKLVKVPLFGLLLLFALLLEVRAQEPVQLGKINADCAGAVLIRDSIGPVYSPQGWGNILEIKGYELGDPMFIEQEHNTIWYKFTAPGDGVLELDIVPIYPEDDFDFMLFLYDGPSFCKTIQDDQAVPLRSNISRKNVEVRGYTGLKKSAVEEFVPSGPGDSYSRALPVKKDQQLYLLVDNPFRENRGHYVYLYWDIAGGVGPRKREEPKQKAYDPKKTKLHIEVRDKETGEPVPAFVSIEGTVDGSPLEFEGVSDQEAELVSYRAYYVSAVSKGYLLATKAFMPSSDADYYLQIDLKKVKQGDKMTLEDIKFVEDKAEFLEKSISSLKKLTKFMLENPGVEVEIGGHVNGLTKKNKKEYKELSTTRAEAVETYLLENGVEKERMKVKGYGNSEMLFPDPANNGQMEANRRVEIKILKN
jgi:outer membrane protein OmpA-like peptidoglycan-associated protein